MYNTQNQLANTNFYASHPVFQPGFAGTNPQEVRQDIAREVGYAPVNVGQFAQLSQVGTPFTNVQAVFQPGFAGTNPQEVRQDIAREIGYVPTYPVNAAFQNPNVGVSSIPVQVPGVLGGAQAIFQPGFAGTNPQEVRQDIARSISPYQAVSYQQTPLTQQVYGAGLTTVPTYQTTSVPQFTSGVQAIFQPGFAGTNVQEVRTLNAGYQSPQQAFGIGYSTVPAYQAATVNQFGVLPTGVYGR